MELSDKPIQNYQIYYISDSAGNQEILLPSQIETVRLK